MVVILKMWITGIIGLALLVLCPFLSIWRAKKDNWVVGVMVGMVLFVFGYGFFLSWLISG